MASSHPFKVIGASMVSGQVRCYYQIAQPDVRVTAAHLCTPDETLLVGELAPGVLAAQLPAKGGTLHLIVDELSAPVLDAPPLPWKVGLFLPPAAVRDYTASEPCGATLDLGEDGTILADRLLRGTTLFWDWQSAQQAEFWTGYLIGEVPTGRHSLPTSAIPYHVPVDVQGATGAGMPGGPLLPVQVHALTFAGAPAEGPLVLRVRMVQLQVGGPWQIPVAIPGSRPAVAAVGRALAAGDGVPTLAEVLLSQFHTDFLFHSGAQGAVELAQHLSVVDDAGRTYHASTGSSGDDYTECRFEALPVGIERITLSGQGFERRIQGTWQLPLEPGGRGLADSSGDRSDLFFGGQIVGTHSSVSMPSPAPDEKEEAVQVPNVDEKESVPVSGIAEAITAPDRERLQAWLKDRLILAQRLTFTPVPWESLSARESHVGGPPFQPAGEPWPSCGFCDKPLTFIGQVRLAGMPDLPDGAELLTFHYCFECLPFGSDQEPAYRLRLHRGVDDVQLVVADPPNGKRQRHQPIHCRISMVQAVSGPSWEDAQDELAEWGLGPQPWEVYTEVWQELTDAPNMESLLGGYPGWIQSAEWPDCPNCGQRMHLLWQLDSEQLADLMWGDTGRVYVFSCPDACTEGPLTMVMQCC